MEKVHLYEKPDSLQTPDMILAPGVKVFAYDGDKKGWMRVCVGARHFWAREDQFKAIAPEGTLSGLDQDMMDAIADAMQDPENTDDAPDADDALDAHAKGTPHINIKALKELRAAAAFGDLDAQYELALMYHLGQLGELNGAEAERWYSKAANQGHLYSITNLGCMYRRGEGVPVNSDKARVLFLKAAAEGDYVAQFNLGDMAEWPPEDKADDAPDLTEAIAWYTKAAEADYGPAQVRMGFFYMRGEGGLEEDPEKAVAWWQKSTKHDMPDGWINLGHAYRLGMGIKKSNKDAMRCFAKAAELGEPEAEFLLGQMYYDGATGIADYKKARFWWDKAAKANHGLALCQIGLMYRYGTMGEKDPAKALEYIEKAHKNKDPEGTFQLGLLHLTGTGVPKSDEKAMGLLIDATSKGHTGAQYYAGRLKLRQARDILKSVDDATEPHTKTKTKKAEGLSEEGLRMLENAAEQGQDGAYISIGDVYIEGRLVEKDIAKAMEYYQKAAEDGDTEGYISLASLLLEFVEHQAKIGRSPETYETEVAQCLDALSMAAELDNTDAMVMLGNIFWIGSFLDTDEARAAAYYQQAAAAGSPSAMLNLGQMKLSGCKAVPATAKDWFTRAAALGSIEGELELGQMYLYGRTVTQDVRKALHHLDNAKASRFVDVMCILGQYYYAAAKTPTDKEAAGQYFEQALDKSGRAAYEWGQLLLKDAADAPASEAQAIKLLKLAVSMGELRGAEALAVYLNTQRCALEAAGEKLPLKYQQMMVQHAALAAKEIHSPACLVLLGIWHEEGRIVEKHANDAFEYFRQAYIEGAADGGAHLARLLLYGTQQQQNHSEGFEIATCAARLGSVLAMRLVGQCYEFSRGTARDMPQAGNFYLKQVQAEGWNGEAAHNLLRWAVFALKNKVCTADACLDLFARADLASDQAAHMLAAFICSYYPKAGLYSVAWSLASMAADKGYPPAQSLLAWFLILGKTFIKKDVPRGMQLLAQAGRAGDMDAQMWLGDLYRMGRIVPQDIEKALFWYGQAARQGNVKARQAIETLSS
jgi:TPR repeat protein